MKKSKLFVFISLFVIFAIFMSACSSKLSVAKSFDEVLNKDYYPAYDLTEGVIEVSELKDMSFLDSKGEFMTFSSGDVDTGITIAVFSTRNQKVVFSGASSSTEAIEVTLYSNVPAFTVMRTTLGACADAVSESVCELYDATGALVAKTKNLTVAPMSFADNILFENVAYSIDEKNGSISKISEIPENLYLENCDDWNDTYFYTFAETVNIYSRDFSHAYGWSYPSWAERLSVNALNNGNVLVQYLRPLDNLSEKYDIYETDENTGVVSKYDLFSVILDPEKKEERTIELSYVIHHIATENDLALASENNGMYREGFENIAQIIPIVDSQIDDSDSSIEIVELGNNGEIKKSFKIVDGQGPELPICVSKGVYIVPTIYGSAFVDINGELLHQINNTTIDTTEKNIIIDGVIYTFDMNEVYSVHENNAEVITYLNGTVFVKELGETEAKIMAISADNVVEIGSCPADELDLYFEALNDSGCYSLFNSEKGEYSYYNSDHKLLYTSGIKLESVASDFVRNLTVYVSMTDTGTSYYIFN